MPYPKLIECLNLDVTESCLNRALAKQGYRRQIALKKPFISEKNHLLRLEWAEEHVNWEDEDWDNILWTDESWVKGGRHRKTRVTRRTGEELHEDCVTLKIQCKRGWMIWGCINGSEKGPCLFWEKEWGTINSETYSERIVPIIHGWMTLNPHLQLMQDGAPEHGAKNTQEELNSRGIYPIFWPPYSPDLNPIETLWNIMKDYIDDTYPLEHNPTYDRLWVIVKEAWDMLDVEKVKELTSGSYMRAHCQAVIDANGKYTKY